MIATMQMRHNMAGLPIFALLIAAHVTSSIGFCPKFRTLK
jgi:hypothetical protein